MQIVKSLVTATVIALGLTAVSTAMASEDKYPAYNFQPSVIYSNPELIEKTSSLPASRSASVQAAAPAVVADPKYPAAYFVPSVIYPAR